MDSSGSLKDDYGTEKLFLKALAATFGIGSDASRAGVVTFSYYAEHSIKLNDHTDIADFNAAVDAIPLMGSQTRIDTALRLAQKELFSIINGARPAVPKLLILLTDGSQTQSAGAEDPSAIASEIRNSGVNLLVVGIGKGINGTELLEMAAKEDNLFSTESFDELLTRDFITKVANRSCEKGTTSLIIPPFSCLILKQI